jgi:hypothetical protein
MMKMMMGYRNRWRNIISLYDRLVVVAGKFSAFFKIERFFLNKDDDSFNPPLGSFSVYVAHSPNSSRFKNKNSNTRVDRNLGKYQMWVTILRSARCELNTFRPFFSCETVKEDEKIFFFIFLFK